MWTSTAVGPRFVGLMVLALASSCGVPAPATVDAGPPPGAPTRPTAPSPATRDEGPIDGVVAETERALSPEASRTDPALDELFHRLAARAAREHGTVDGVRIRALAARVALARADLEGAAASTRIAEAREQLTAAASRNTLEGACEASLELARLEARHASDFRAAYVAAYRLRRRFPPGPCVTSAEWMMSVLSAFRPVDAVLAAIDENPERGGVDAGPDGPDASGLTAPVGSAMDVASWAASGASPTVPARPQAPARLEQVLVLGEGSRIVLAFDRVVLFERRDEAASGELPPRVSLTLPNARKRGDLPDVFPGRGPVHRIRVMPTESEGIPGARPTRERGLRIVVDLVTPTRYQVFFLTNPFRIVLDFRPGALSATDSAPTRVRTIVLDPGHGGEQPGASYGGLREADIALDVAHRVRALLLRRLPGMRVLLTRADDRYLTLEERTAFANGIGADVFASIHVNGASDPGASGAGVFVLDTTADRALLAFAARENGTSIDELSNLQVLLAHAHRQGQSVASMQLATSIQSSMVASARRIHTEIVDRGVRQAVFYVLVGASMPAVLVEVSFLSNPLEQRLLGTVGYRQALAEGIAEGLVRYARAH
ncbi:MAG: N-acetylmuramoyl-L-alanine amidase [Deltaproteobacteria bacterium]|nr:N-acetylmuramoyl-L-alanine amidase [Deltaproteobacteria bacterium]